MKNMLFYRLDMQVNIFKSVLAEICRKFPVDTTNIEVKTLLDCLKMTRDTSGIYENGIEVVDLQNLYQAEFIKVDLDQVFLHLSQQGRIKVNNQLNKYKIRATSVGWLPIEYLQMLKRNIDKSFTITSEQLAKDLGMPFKEIVDKNTRWSQLGDDSLNISKNKKYFKLMGKEYTFAKNSKNPFLIIEGLLTNKDRGFVSIKTATNNAREGESKRDYEQFIKSIFNCTKSDFEKSELEMYFEFNQRSKTISFKKLAK